MIKLHTTHRILSRMKNNLIHLINAANKIHSLAMVFDIDSISILLKSNLLANIIIRVEGIITEKMDGCFLLIFDHSIQAGLPPSNLFSPKSKSLMVSTLCVCGLLIKFWPCFSSVGSRPCISKSLAQEIRKRKLVTLK